MEGHHDAPVAEGIVQGGSEVVAQYLAQPDRIVHGRRAIGG
jgi:hypothetical protein